jgi:hypothetical protein
MPKTLIPEPSHAPNRARAAPREKSWPSPACALTVASRNTNHTRRHTPTTHHLQQAHTHLAKMGRASCASRMLVWLPSKTLSR